MNKILLLILIFPLTIRAMDNQVPLGTKGNTLVFTVSNTTSKSIKRPVVFVSSTPDWLSFHSPNAVGDSIPINGSRDFTFEFDVANGEAGRSGSVQLTVLDTTGHFFSMKSLAIRAVLAVDKTLLSAPYPNPANPSVTIPFAIIESGHVKMDIYNVLGQRTRTLLNEERPAGQWEVQWDGRNDQGVPVSSGVYIVHMTTTAKSRVQHFKTKIILEK
jgi:hypothetical protein